MNICFGIDKEMEDIVVIKVNNYSVFFDELFLEIVNFEIKLIDKVVLIGLNGIGKIILFCEIYKNN